MTLVLNQSATAVGANSPASFVAAGGLEPYLYAVVPGGGGGVINSATGAFTAPSLVSSDPKRAYTTIEVTDDAGDTATARILVARPLLLFCEVLQRELELPDGRVYLWDQKIMQPTDSDLYIAVSELSFHPFASVNRPAPNGDVLDQQQTLNILATVQVDAISRGPAARDRKEEIVLAMNSVYSQQQQTANSFYISRLSNGTKFVNLSEPDGAAIPYRYAMTFSMQYGVVRTKAAQFFDTFDHDSIVNE